MNLRKPNSPVFRGALAVLALLYLAMARLAAQTVDPLSLPPPPTNEVAVTNLVEPELVTKANDTNSLLERYEFILATARYQANLHNWNEAENNYVKLLVDGVPEPTRQIALFEMAQVVRSENDLPRAQAMYAQYLVRWPGDARTPEIFLKQGQIFREMGLANLALTKFYGVMTMALSIKNGQMDYYRGLVLKAQEEIAETHYLIGDFKDAADYYSRLLTQNDPALDRAQIQFRLIRSLEAIDHHDEAASQALDFLAHFQDSPEEPEVRYHLAHAYKGQNRNTEALQQVRVFLQEERARTTNDPAVWSYWQQRVGNEIGNQLYQEGDYVKALEIYLALAQLDAAPAWQLPVRYQVGLTYERLLQPRLAEEAYRNVLTNAVSLNTTNLAPNLKSVLDMATWRLNFLEWNERAEAFNHQTIAAATTTNTNRNPNLTHDSRN
ncbi:MAG TPA: tetratricopeptide repeat protein [Candidatus Acidoferrales bacterium]|nr:tetratricopeptide repeat protein [Candidatus Acidoferrales bacterium]